MSTQRYLLVRRTPEGVIKAHSMAFDCFMRTARVAGQVLLDSGAVRTKPAAMRFVEALRKQPIGVIWGHPSGYDFRILRAHFTTDHVAITPGLRVITNDLKWGIVETGQFMHECDAFGPGGQFHDGWYLVSHEDGTPYAKFNGERLGTSRPRGLC